MAALTMEEIALAYELRQDKCSWQRIGAGLGCDPVALSKVMHRVSKRGLGKHLTGYRPVPGRPPRYHLDIVRKAHAMHLKGSSWRGISRELLDNDSRAEAERLRQACRMAKHYLNEESGMIKQPPGADYATAEKMLESWRNQPVSSVQSKLLDLHTMAAALMYGTQYHLVTDDQRRAAKSRNFMAMYTPGTQWVLPAEAAMMAIYTEEQRLQLCLDLRVSRPGLLYQALQAHFQGTS